MLDTEGVFTNVLQKFDINDDTKSVSTPLAPHFKLRAAISPTTVEECEYKSHIPYVIAADSLMYAIVCTRLNLSQVTV